MGINMIGIDHNSARIEDREIFSFTRKQAAEALEKLYKIEDITGVLILSTCNRMEIWWSSLEDRKEAIYETLWGLKGVKGRELFLEREEDSAIDHLFKLTAGLKSQVLGEDQILTQVKDAVSFARDHYTLDILLETLFRMAVTAGKKVKTQVHLAAGNSSLAHKAIAELKRDGYVFSGKRAMVIGNGEMGQILATLLREEGMEVTVTIRQYRSGILKIPFGCERINYGERMTIFKDCDLVASATASPNYTLHYEEVKEVLPEGEMILLDLALPRDMEPEIASLKGVTLFDVDQFGTTENEEMEQALTMAETILDEQKEVFFSWYQNKDVLDKLGEIRDLAMADLGRRLEKALLKAESCCAPSDVKKDIERATEKIMNKLIFGLRNTVSEEVFRECVEGLEQIYLKEERTPSEN